MDMSNIYEIHLVCKTCYKLYQWIADLKETHMQFADLIGIQHEMAHGLLEDISGHERGANPAFEQKNHQQDQIHCGQKKNYSPRASQTKKIKTISSETNANRNHIASRSTEEIVMRRNDPISLKDGKPLKKLHRYRMIIMTHGVDRIPADVDVVNKNFYIEFSVFGKKMRYKLDLIEATYLKQSNSPEKRSPNLD
jgi:hypothetical protein